MVVDKLMRKLSSTSESESGNRTRTRATPTSTTSGKFSLAGVKMFDNFKSNFRLDQEEVGAKEPTPRFCDQWEADNTLNLQGGMTSSRFMDNSSRSSATANTALSSSSER